MVRISIAVFSASIMLSALSVAQAADKSVYVALRIGTAFQSDDAFDLTSAVAVPTLVKNAYESGSPSGSAAIGMDLMDGFRGEIELSYNKEAIKSHTIIALPETLSNEDALGNTSITTAMVNGYYDVDFGGFELFGTAGLGNSWVDFQNHAIAIPTDSISGLSAGIVTAMDDQSSGITWQVGGGINFDWTGETSIELGYRYKMIHDVALTAVDGTETDVDLESHAIFAGFRLSVF